MKKFYWSLAVFALLFISAISTTYAEDKFIAKHGDNFVVYESLEKGEMLFKLLSPQGKVLWSYKLQDKDIIHYPQYANGKIYELGFVRQYVFNLYSIEVGGAVVSSKEIVGSGTQLTQTGVFYNKNEEKSIYFSRLSDLDSEIVYAIPNSRVLSEAHSTGDYHLVVIGHFEGQILYILQEGKIIAQIELPDYSTLTGLEQIGNQIFFFVRAENSSYLYVYHLQEQSFLVRKVLSSDDSLFVLYILPKDHGYTLYGSFKDKAFAMELNEQLELLGNKLYLNEEQQNVEYIEQGIIVWDEEKSKAIPLEDLPVEKFKMWLS